MLDTSFFNITLLQSELDSAESSSEELSEVSSAEVSSAEFSSESFSEVSSEEVDFEEDTSEEEDSQIYAETIDYSGTLYTMNENIVTLTDRFTELYIVVFFAVCLSVIILVYRIFAWFWKDL